MENLDGKKFDQLNDNLHRFILYMFDNSLDSDDIINCVKKGGMSKSDLIISVGSKSYSISIKMGIGNSVHQEPVDEFIKFLKYTYGIDDNLANDLRLFIWGDGTLDGNGLVSNRLTASQFKDKYPEIIENIRKFFYQHKKDLIKRFLINGPKSNSAPDFIYYGTYLKGFWKDSKSVLNWLSDDCNESSRAPIPVGKFTFQAWNRNINGGIKSEHKRGVIQLKWGSISSDLKLIMKV